jgi:hypothetical protein
VCARRLFDTAPSRITAIHGCRSTARYTKWSGPDVHEHSVVCANSSHAQCGGILIYCKQWVHEFSALSRPRGVNTISVRLDFTTVPRAMIRSFIAGTMKLIVNSVVDTPLSAGIRLRVAYPAAESAMALIAPLWTKPCYCEIGG